MQWVLLVSALFKWIHWYMWDFLSSSLCTSCSVNSKGTHGGGRFLVLVSPLYGTWCFPQCLTSLASACCVRTGMNSQEQTGKRWDSSGVFYHFKQKSPGLLFSEGECRGGLKLSPLFVPVAHKDSRALGSREDTWSANDGLQSELCQHRH